MEGLSPFAVSTAACGEADVTAQRDQSCVQHAAQKAREGYDFEALSVEGSERFTSSDYGGQQTVCPGSVEAELLMKELKKQMQPKRQQQAAAATRAAAAEALMHGKKDLGNKRLRPSTLLLVRRPLDEVTLVPAEASETAAPNAAARVASPDGAMGGASNSEAVRVLKDELCDMIGCGSSSNNGSEGNSRKVELIDVSINDKHLEEQILCECPELRLLLRRGLTFLEFTEKATLQEQEHQAQKQSKKHIPDQLTYLLVRRGLPKFFDFDWESLACFFLQALLQQQPPAEQQQQQQQKQKQQPQEMQQEQHQEQHKQEQQQEQQQQLHLQRMAQPVLQAPAKQQETDEQHEQQQDLQGRQKVKQRIQKPAQQPQGEGGKQQLKQTQRAVVSAVLGAANRKSNKQLLSAHQLSQCLLQSFSTPSVSNNAAKSSTCSSSSCSKDSKMGFMDVWALEKLNGEAAQISFCSKLKAWACCSKNVCLILPATAASSSSKYTMLGPDEVRAATARTGEGVLQHREGDEAQGPYQQEEQPSGEHQRKKKMEHAVELMRQLGADRIASQPFSLEEPVRPPREHYALRVAEAWKQQLQQLTEAQVHDLQQLLHSHTLVGELIDSAEKQHIVPAPKRQHYQQHQQKLQQQQQWQRQQEEQHQQNNKEQQQGQEKKQQARARTGRLAFFALVPHKLNFVGAAFCEPACLSPSVSLPLLQSLGLETAAVVSRLQASSPLDLLLQLRRLDAHRAESCAGDTEGLVLYFCRCSSNGGSSSSGSNFAQGGSSVVALAKAKTAAYRLRRKLRERLKCLMRSDCFWEATAAAAAASAASAARWPTDEEAERTNNLSYFDHEALAAATRAAAATSSLHGINEELTLPSTATNAGPAAESTDAEATLRVQMAATVGMYWCSVLEVELFRFDDLLRACVHEDSPLSLIQKVLRLKNDQVEKNLLPRQLQRQLQRQRLVFDHLVREESTRFRRAAAFACSLAAALLLALRCLPDPQRVRFLKQKQQSLQQLHLQQQRQEQLEACNLGGVQLEKDLEDIAFLQDLIHGPAEQGKLLFRGCLFRFLTGYVDMRFLDFMEDSKAFAAVTGAPLSWIAPPQKMLAQLQHAKSNSSGISGSLAVDIVRMADLKEAGATVMQQLQENKREAPKSHSRRQGKYVGRQHQQRAQVNKLRWKQQPLTACLVAPPLLLTADQYQELQQVCQDHGCHLLLRHRACVSAGCCCLRDSCSSCSCDTRAKDAVSAATADGSLFASVVVFLGFDQHGDSVSLERLHQLLQQRELENQQAEQQKDWDGIALVGNNGVVEGLLHCTLEQGVFGVSSAKTNRFLAVNAAVGKAILQARTRTVAEGILALASKCCANDMLEAICGSSTVSEDLQTPLWAATEASGPSPSILRLPASLLVTETGAPNEENWRRALEQFAAAVKAVMYTAGNNSLPHAQDRPKTPLGPPHASASPGGPQNAGVGFDVGCSNMMSMPTDSSGLHLEPSSAVSVVALLPVGLPGSGKTTVLLEALRPALRQEFMSRNTFSVGGATGVVIWEGRPLLSPERMGTVVTTTEATTAVAETVTAAAAKASNATATVMTTPVTAAAAEPSAATAAAAAGTNTAAPLQSVFDCACFLSSDESTGEVLRTLGYNAPMGSLYELCLQEAARVGPAATARLNSPCLQRGIGSPASVHADEKTMKAAIEEGRRTLASSLNRFFTHLTETIVRRFLQQQTREEGLATAGAWRPFRVLVVVDRNHPPNAISSRFGEVERLLHALQSTVLMRCGGLVEVATAALLLPPDAAQDGSSVLLRRPGGYPRARNITWDYPWSMEVVLRSMYRVLCRGDHPTLSGGRRCYGPLEGLSDGASDSDIARDVKSLHVCLSFLSCFKGYSKVDDFLRMHPSVTHVLQLQTVLPTEQQRQQEHCPQEQKHLQNQQQLLLTALSSLKPFGDPPKNQRVYMDLAASLRQFPPDVPVFGESEAKQRASISRCAGQLLQCVDDLFLSMEERLLLRRDQLLQQRLQEQQSQRQHGIQQQRHHDNVAPCGRLQQPQGDLDQAIPEEGSMASLNAVSPPTSIVTLRLPTYFSVFLGSEKEALASLTQQLVAAAQSAGGSSASSVVDICKNLKAVDSPHVTTFFLGGGTLKTNRGEIEAANEWLDEQFRSASTHDISCRDSSSKGASSYTSLSSRILLLHELLASQRQISLNFKFQTTHLLLTDIGLACAALTPFSPILALAEPPPPHATRSKAFVEGSTLSAESIYGNPDDDSASLGLVAGALDFDAGLGDCRFSCVASGPHGVSRRSSDSQPLCMAAYHYAHVTLGLSGDATAVMSNDAIAAADMAILQGIRDKKLRADTLRPFRTGGPRNSAGMPEDEAKCPSAGDAYQDLTCYSVGDSDDSQELILFTGVPIKGRRSRLWVWSLPTEVREELEGPVQAR